MMDVKVNNKFDTRIFLVDKPNEAKKFTSIQLKHPGTEKPTQFLLSKPDNNIYELLSFNEKHRSWFIDNSVASNGQIYVPIEIDPLYLVLSYLSNCDPKKVEPIDHVLIDSEYPDLHNVLKIVNMKDIILIADQKGPQEINAFKYNEDKTLAWLKKKCLNVVEALKKSNIQTGQNVTSQNYVNVNANQDEGAYLSTAHGIVSEYISMSLSGKLATYMNIIDENKQTSKRKSMNDLENPAVKKNRPSIENGKLTEEPESKEVKKIKQKNATMAKAATGTKNIMSFFKKPA